MIEHSISYVRANLEKLIKAGLPIRITRHGMTVGYYNPVKRMTSEKTWEAPETGQIDEFTGIEIVKE